MKIEQDLETSELPESTNHSFVIKIWLEETRSEAGKTLWRGSITHVSSGRRRYFQQVKDVLPFISSYLLKWGQTS
jgi:hypothetical protein